MLSPCCVGDPGRTHRNWPARGHDFSFLLGLCDRGFIVFPSYWLLLQVEWANTAEVFLPTSGRQKLPQIGIFGGVLFNLANIPKVAAIDIVGMSGGLSHRDWLALVIGVISNYDPATSGNPVLLFAESPVTLAIVLDAVAYRRLSPETKTTVKGIILSILCGILMGFFIDSWLNRWPSCPKGKSWRRAN